MRVPIEHLPRTRPCGPTPRRCQRQEERFSCFLMPHGKHIARDLIHVLIVSITIKSLQHEIYKELFKTKSSSMTITRPYWSQSSLTPETIEWASPRLVS